MTPEEFGPEELEPAQSDEAVRRLLAAAAEPVTMPPDVTARLEDVLAGLDADRAISHGAVDVAPVIDLAERRTSRWPKLLVAAAAVSVLGVGLGNVLNQNGSTMSADSANSTTDGGLQRGAEAAPSPEDSQGGPQVSTDEQGDSLDGFGALDGARPPRLRSSSATVDAQRIADGSLPTAPADLIGRSSKDCRLPVTSKGDVWIAVRLDGQPATLVFRAEADGRRLTEVFSCGDPESPVLTTTVDVR